MKYHDMVTFDDMDEETLMSFVLMLFFVGYPLFGELFWKTSVEDESLLMYLVSCVTRR